MGKCTAVPYEGREPYLFVSFCHEDEAVVLPAIELLYREGIRLWFDEGIAPGDEWPEVIANHLDGAAAVLAFFSVASVHSHNCRREFNFALMENKPTLGVLLEEFPLTPVMKLQFSTIQRLSRMECASAEDLFAQIRRAPLLACCQGEGPVPVPAGGGEVRFFLERRSTGERILISHDGFKVGRKKELCDYVIDDNLAVSRLHAVFSLRDGRCFIRDNHSMNKVYVNDVLAPPDEDVPLQDGDLADIGRELFIVRKEEM